MSLFDLFHLPKPQEDISITGGTTFIDTTLSQSQHLLGVGQSAVQQSLLAAQNNSLTQGSHWTNVNSIYSPPTYSIGLINLIEVEKWVKEQHQHYKLFKDQLDIINDLHPKTKQILHLVSELKEITDYKKIDKFVREQLFRDSLEKLLDEPQTE